MIRLNKQIIKREDVFTWLQNPDVLKVELSKRHNKSLKDDNVCKVHIYLNDRWNNLATMAGMMGALENDGTIPEYEFSLIKGLVNVRKDGFIPMRFMQKLVEISEVYKVNLGISKSIKELVKKYAIFN